MRPGSLVIVALLLAIAAPAMAGWRTIRTYDPVEDRTITRTVWVDDDALTDRVRVYDPVTDAYVYRPRSTVIYGAPVVTDPYYYDYRYTRPRDVGAAIAADVIGRALSR